MTTYLCCACGHYSGSPGCPWVPQQWVDPPTSESPLFLVQSSFQVGPPLRVGPPVRVGPLHWVGFPRPVDHLPQMNPLPTRASPASGTGSGDGQAPGAAGLAAVAGQGPEKELGSTEGARDWGTGEPCG